MKKIILTLLVSWFALPVISQDKLLTLQDALVLNRTSLAPANLNQLQFIYNSGDYVYLSKDAVSEKWMRGNFNSKEEKNFLTLGEMNKQLHAAGFDSTATMPSIQFNHSADWVMMIKSHKIALNPVTNVIRYLLPDSIYSKQNAEESKAGYIAYLDKHDLFVSGNGRAKKITFDGSRDIVYASSVHREEFGITKGIFWSNAGKKLAFYRMDQSMVTDYPVIDWSDKPAKSYNVKYPMAGDSSHHVTVGVYNAETGALTWLKTGESREQYLTNIAWSPNDAQIYIAVLNRDQDHMKLNVYDASSGDFIKTLFEEKDEKYVEPLNPVLFVKNDATKFIWQSNRDGWNHLYLYDVEGNLIKQLTKGNWEVTEVKGFDHKSENLFFSSTKESPVTKNLYSVNLKTLLVTRITNGQGQHVTQISTDGKFIIDNYSSPGNPRTIQLVQTSNGKTKQVFVAANPLAAYRLGKMEVFSINGVDGNPLYCRMYKPPGFDSTVKHPVIVYWYGGPHAQLITENWNGGASDYWFHYMAQRGYVVFSIDTRGSDNRGKNFEQDIFKNVGKAQKDDLVMGVNYLKSKPWVDQSNMGLFGWSFGGFLTIDFMLSHPGVFKSAVAGGPVTDWSYYEIMYTERYMDHPKKNMAGYMATDLSRQVEKLKGKLLLIHGLQDDVVVQQHSVKFVRAAIKKNVQVDYMIYPGHFHNVLGTDRVHLFQKVTDYMEENLRSGSKAF